MPLNQQARRRQIRDDKISLIRWSRNLPGHAPDNNNWDILDGRLPHRMWANQDGSWEFFFYKFGNEYGYNGYRKNGYDMKPVLKHNGQWVRFDESFQHFFNYIDELHQLRKIDALMLLSEFFLRNAYLFEHQPINGVLTFFPNPQLIAKIVAAVGNSNPQDSQGHPIPIEAYLHYLDGIAHNEDVKYHERLWKINNGNYNVLDEGTGRENNQLTLALYINIVLGTVNVQNGTQRIRELSSQRNGGALKELIGNHFSEATINALYPTIFY